LLFNHILLEKFLSYDPCFSYTLLNLFISLLIIIFSYLGGKNNILSYQPALLIFPAADWFIATFYCILRCLFDRGPRFSNFQVFYRNVSIVFILSYTVLLIFILIYPGNSISSDYSNLNIIPFFTVATVIEDYINGKVTTDFIIQYLTKGIFLFVPYGFYVILLLRRSARLIRAFALLLLPVLIEVVQFTFLYGKADIDDIILGWLGGIIGGLSFHLLNLIFRTISDEGFLEKRSRYSSYHSSLHF
jgi:glycopeptide antibiotics resistance protein